MEMDIGPRLGLGAQGLNFYVLERMILAVQSSCPAGIGQMFNKEGISSCLFLGCFTSCG